MSSRLDRLLLLLENGSTPVIRKSAAEQLGDVQKLYPHELENLLNKVHAYLMNNQWETRVAASQAVEAIIRNVEQWNPQGVPKGRDSAGDSNYLSLSAFDVSRVLEGGVQLIMCDAKSFDLPINPDDPVNQDVNNKERLMEQKQQLNKRLGLEMCTALRISTPAVDGLITEEDFVVQETTESIHPQISSVNDFINERLSTNGIERKQDCGGNVVEASSGHHPPLKRKAEDFEETSNSKKLKVERSQSSDGEGGTSRVSPTHDSEEKQAKDWPLMSFSNLLSNNLFNQIWEKRHGSALGLKVLVKLHGRGAGRNVDTSTHELARSNQRWLEDLCVRLMCVLALDRLGDFLSDEVVAPVRESCAQVIGVACLHLEPMGIVSVVKALLQLVDYPKDMWEVKHGGLLGIKYVLAVRQDLTDRLLQEVLPSVCRCLADNSDDVRSVAASALIPVTNALATHSPTKALEIIDSLWTSLKELDDLTSSTNSVMTLLSLLISHPDIYNKCQNDSLSSLVPLIWPFLGHNISSVRRATLLTLNTLLQKSMTMASDNTNQNSPCHWIRPILSSMLRLIFQRSVVEHEPYVLELVGQVWSSILSCADVPHLVAAVVPYFSSWMCLSMHPSNIPMDRNLFLILPSKGGEQSGGDNNFVKEDFIFLGGLSNIADSESERDALVVRARLTSTKLLGQLCHRIADRKKLSDVKKEEHPHIQPPQDPSFPPMPPGYLDAVANDLSTLFQVYLNSKSAIQRMVTAWVVKEWAESAIRDGMVCECPPTLVARFKACLVDVLYYDEIASKFTRLQTECRAFMASLLTWGAKLEKPFNDIGALLTLEQISQLCSVVSQRSLCREGLSSQQESAYQKQKAELEANLSQVTALQDLHSNRVQCGIASVLVELRDYPDSLNPVIRPLMDCLKMEENSQSQEKTAEVLSQVVEHHKDRMPCPSTKIVKNLCSMYCIDATVSDESWDKFSDIQVLKSRQQIASSWRPRKYGPHKKNKEEVEGVDVSQNNNNQPTKDPNEVQKRGSVLALTSITRRPGSQLPTWVPDLWKVMFNSLETFATSALSNSIKEEPDSKMTSSTRPTQTDPRSSDNGVNIPSSSSADNTPSEIEAQDLLRSLTVLNLVAPQLDAGLQKALIDHFPHFLHCVEHPYTSVRHMAGRCLATVARLATEVTMEIAVSRRLVPWLCDSTNDRRKMGAVEALSLIIEELNVALVPYLVSLVLPMLGAMSDSNPGIRLVATNSFATLVRLMPLDKSMDMNSAEGRSDSPHARPDTVATRVNKNYERDHMFLEQLLNPKLIEDFQIPVKLKVELRRYQQDGVNWLSFLSRYKLHGILCDDMGLGKTLQSLCIIVSEHYRKEQALKNKQTDEKPPISLVVCPPTLTAHWLYEVEKVVPSDIIRPLHYVGSPSERTRLQKYVSGSNLVLASYDVVRNDIDFFSNIKWNYCILDEGHVIKNNKTKLSKAIKQLQCSHRLILSGTPIQNNVLELWSLFDFLMPGYLGTEKQFQLTFGRPILASRDARSSSKEQEAGTLALEALHRQVLPFMLRRLKEDVLKDLPPKIISDYYCDLSPLQVKLYEDYSKQHMDKMEVSTLVDDDNKKGGDDDDAKPSEGGSSQAIEADGKKGKKKEKVSHVFQALQYLRKVCNHPMLAMNRHDDDSLREISHTSKLVALKQLLNDCGIGLTDASAVPSSSSSSSTSDAMSGGCVPVVSQHRVILFCQMKIMLDIIEKDLFKRHMPTVTYLRLDGSIPAVNRLQIVHRFNNDPSIDVLLLTTQVGGLGLNLTGADTVVFYDHDWNPMKDLQAMDRAHRIGQKKVVTVYRLITRGTLEEKIMGLQKFKMNVAQSVVNQDNHSLAAMTSNQVLDLFCLNKNSNSKDHHNVGDHGSGRGMKSFMEGFESLWDETQYRDEYDIDTFMKCLDG